MPRRDSVVVELAAPGTEARLVGRSVALARLGLPAVQAYGPHTRNCDPPYNTVGIAVVVDRIVLGSPVVPDGDVTWPATASARCARVGSRSWQKS